MTLRNIITYPAVNNNSHRYLSAVYDNSHIYVLAVNNRRHRNVFSSECKEPQIRILQ